MTIIHYIPTIDRKWGGTTAYMQLLSNELGKLAEFHIITHASDNPVSIMNCEIHYIETTSHYRKMKKQLLSLLHDINPDIVHINGCWIPGCAYTQKWAQQLGYKAIVSPHGMLEPWIMARHYWTRKMPALLLYQKEAITKANYVHATAESEKQNLLRLGYNKKIEIIPNGIEVDKIQLKENWKRKKKILFLSRIHIKKGIEYLIEAVAALKDELSGYTITIAGEGDSNYVKQLKKKTETLHIASLFDFCGGVYDTKKWELFKNADLFLLPTYSENFGIVIAEALASGTPVITTQGTPWHELETYKCGWWKEIGTVPTIDALKQFLSLSQTELEIMGRNGRKLIEEKYSSQKMAEDMIKLYNKVIMQ